MNGPLGVGFVMLVLSTLAACAPAGTEPGEPPGDRAARLARELLIIDTHIDVPYRLREKMEDVGASAPGGDFDYPRARAGGLDVAFMSIYVPARHQATGDAGSVANELLDMVDGIVASHPDKFRAVTSAAEARSAGGSRVGLALGMENGAGIDGRVENLEHFYRRGIRYITLAHSRNNRICDSSYDPERRWNGLSELGREVVHEMNRLGMMIDVSHVSDEAFRQVLDHSRAPVIASHSSCRRFTPDWERNMSDEMIQQLAENGGVIQINFGSSFIDNDYRLARREARERIKAELERRGVAADSDHARSYEREYYEANPLELARLADVVDHIEHVIRLVGVDHVGLGSDFDGVGDSLPLGLEDVSGYPNLIRELLLRGYSEDDVAKICAGNLLRVWEWVERVAADVQQVG